jgi:hypothetical protein
MERTHLQKHDLDWLPPSYRALRWTVAGAVWTGMAGAAGAFFYLVGHGGGVYLGGKVLVGVGAAGLYAGDEVARRVLRGRLRKLARGEVDLGALKNEEDGELVHVTGRVRARETFAAFLGDARAVFRRMVFLLDAKTPVVHEAAVDFDLVGPAGEAITIEVEGARLLEQPPRAKHEYPPHPFLALPLPPATSRPFGARTLRALRKPTAIKASEVLLCHGDEVEVVGYKTRRVDPTVASRLERDTPMRASLRSGKALPLLVSPTR